jgi:hypothetical protein
VGLGGTAVGGARRGKAGLNIHSAVFAYKLVFAEKRLSSSKDVLLLNR